MDISGELPIEIQTFVFLDLETTDANSDTRILELSMVGVSRSDLLLMKNNHINGSKNESSQSEPPTLPRVLHKYCRLFYPRKILSSKIEKITGLNNDLLQHLPSFNSETAESIKYFLRLPSPVCIIAHNGIAFDFPIIKAELANVGVDNIEGVVCVDSLVFARHFESQRVFALFPQNEGAKENGEVITPPPQDVDLGCEPLHSQSKCGNGKIFSTPKRLNVEKNETIPITPKITQDVKEERWKPYDIRRALKKQELAASLSQPTPATPKENSRRGLFPSVSQVTNSHEDCKLNFSPPKKLAVKKNGVLSSVCNVKTTHDVKENWKPHDNQREITSFLSQHTPKTNAEDCQWTSINTYLEKKKKEISFNTDSPSCSKDSFQDFPNTADPHTPHKNGIESFITDEDLATLSYSTEISTSDTNKDIYTTPQKSVVSLKSFVTPQHPVKKTTPVTPSTPDLRTSRIDSFHSLNPSVKKALYNSKCFGGSKTPFSQPVLYHRLFQTDYDAHRAEADAIALLQICGHYGEDFVNWADKNWSPFKSIKPRWIKRKSFIL